MTALITFLLIAAICAASWLVGKAWPSPEDGDDEVHL